MINGSDLIPLSCARPSLNPANPISLRCLETSPRRMRCDWEGRQWPSWAPKDHPGYISLRWLRSQICCLFTGCSNLQGGAVEKKRTEVQWRFIKLHTHANGTDREVLKEQQKSIVSFKTCEVYVWASHRKQVNTNSFKYLPASNFFPCCKNTFYKNKKTPQHKRISRVGLF